MPPTRGIAHGELQPRVGFWQGWGKLRHLGSRCLPPPHGTRALSSAFHARVTNPGVFHHATLLRSYRQLQISMGWLGWTGAEPIRTPTLLCLHRAPCAQRAGEMRGADKRRLPGPVSPSRGRCDAVQPMQCAPRPALPAPWSSGFKSLAEVQGVGGDPVMSPLN